MRNSSKSAESAFFRQAEAVEDNEVLCCAPLCVKQANRDLTEIPLCSGHAYQAFFQVNKVITTRASDKPKPLGRHRDSPAVYYLRRNDMVKIGFSTALLGRLQTFCDTADSLLAIEPGGRQREAERHQQFAHHRRGRSEWFEPGEDLLAHIELCRKTWGEPQQYV